MLTTGWKAMSNCSLAALKLVCKKMPQRPQKRPTLTLIIWVEIKLSSSLPTPLWGGGVSLDPSLARDVEESVKACVLRCMFFTPKHRVFPSTDQAGEDQPFLWPRDVVKHHTQKHADTSYMCDVFSKIPIVNTYIIACHIMLHHIISYNVKHMKP